MLGEGRRDEYSGTGRKLDENFRLPEDEMSSVLRVEIPECGNPAPPIREVVIVLVTKRSNVRPKVERRSREDRVREYRDELLVPRSQLSHSITVECV